MLVGGGCSFGMIFEKRRSSEVLYAFKQNGKVVSIVSKACPVLPHPLTSYSIEDIQIETYMEIASFGRIIDGKINFVLLYNTSKIFTPKQYRPLILNKMHKSGRKSDNCILEPG